MKHNYETTLIERDGVLYNRDTNKPHSGHSVSYHQNGQKSYEGTYKDGELDGLFTYWYENGQMREEETYKDGELDGLSTTWYENGQKEGEGNLKDGESDGLWTGWYENGQKSGEITFKDGEKISAKCWDEDGNEKDCPW